MAVKELIVVNILAPLCLFLWAGSSTFAHFGFATKGFENVTPGRWLFSLSVPVFIAVAGLRKRSLSISGAITGVVVGFLLTFASYSFFICLLVFFVTSSKATKYRSDEKKTFEQEFKEGGQRNWIQVLCNSVIAAQFAIFYLLDVGPQELPIDFTELLGPSWLSMGVLGAFACANADTWASELGTVIAVGSPILITTGQIVPKGTNGGVTTAGTIASAVGGAAVGLGFYISELIWIDPDVLRNAPPQSVLIVIGGVSGLIGSLVDSYLGAKFQYSGINEETGCIVEAPGPGVKHICGQPLLDNHAVNLISCLFTAVVTPTIAQLLM